MIVLHEVAVADHEDEQWRFNCVCGAWFRSPDVDEASEAFRSHMAEPALSVEARS